MFDYKNMSLEDKAARLIMIDVPGTVLSGESREHLRKYAWNGVILFAKNVQDRPQTEAFIESLHKNAKAEMFIAIDQEGGLVDRFRFPEMSLSPGAMALGHTDDPKAVYEAHRIMGQELKDLGVHIDFAPCIDINNNPDNPIIGVRSFAETSDKVALMGVQALKGLREGGVIPTVKHFPGHGNTDRDSHLALPCINSSREELEKTELVPFKAAVEAEAEAIMTAHIVFPALDPQLPATLSKAILTDLLRRDLGYKGVIVTDSLSMQAIADRWGFAEASVLSIEAGADLILALGSFERQKEALQGIVEAVRTGRLSEARLDESLARLAKWGGKLANRPLGTIRDTDSHRSAMREITERTPAILNNAKGLLPLKPAPGERVAVIMPDLLPQSPLGEVSRAVSIKPILAQYGIEAEEFNFHTSAFGAPLKQLVQDVSSFDYIILALYARGELSDTQKELAREIPAVCGKTIIVPLSSPYIMKDIPQAHTVITAYNYGQLSLEALVKKIAEG
ncbi:beta-N-acetylhexosaminidase [bacterium]|nr:beta-N-acetylhexosaminidase [bacterium]